MEKITGIYEISKPYFYDMESGYFIATFQFGELY